MTGSVIQDPIATNNTGTLNFDSNGNLVSPSANVSGISFAGLSDGASSLNFTWDLFNSNGTGTISQVNQTSAVSNTALTNGYAAGNYTGFTIGSDGTVTASFSNGQNLNVGQIALGNVTNLQGLSANKRWPISVATPWCAREKWQNWAPGLHGFVILVVASQKLLVYICICVGRQNRRNQAQSLVPMVHEFEYRQLPYLKDHVRLGGDFMKCFPFISGPCLWPSCSMATVTRCDD